MASSRPRSVTAPLSEEGRDVPIAMKLTVVAGPDFGRELALDRGTYTVGKAHECDLALADSSVSRTHITVEVLDHAVRVVDSGSRNGTFFRGSRVGTLELTAPATLSLGRTHLKLAPRDEPRAPHPPSEREAFGGLVGRSLAMRTLFATLERLAPAEVDVLIEGETGTGKDVCARSTRRAAVRAALSARWISEPSPRT